MAGSVDMSPATAHGAEVLPGLGATRAVGADAYLASRAVSRRGLPCITLKHPAACSSPAHLALLRNLPLLACLPAPQADKRGEAAAAAEELQRRNAELEQELLTAQEALLERQAVLAQREMRIQQLQAR